MPTPQLREKLADYIDDAYAMERNVQAMLGSMLDTTEDPEIRQLLEHHREETSRHEESLALRLAAYDRTPSPVKEAGAMVTALGKSLTDELRHDKPAKNARDGYMTEHMEIAAYEMLERLASQAGDQQTADVARRNCADERAMAEKLAASWDKFVALSLTRDGLAVRAGAA